MDSITLSGSASITVTARDWSSKSFSVVIHDLGAGEGPGALLLVPMNFHQFGDLSGGAVAAGDTSTVMQDITGGPNTGSFFLTDVQPLDVFGNVRVNYPAFATDGEFMSWQTGGEYCTADQVLALLRLVEAHEGLNKGEHSHARWFEERFTLTGTHRDGIRFCSRSESRVASAGSGE